MSPDVLGWIASAVFLSRLVPQPARLLRTGVADGVSPMAALNAVVTDLGWLVYGLVVGLVPVWTVAVVSLFPGILMVALLVPLTRRRDLLGATLWLGASIAAWRFGALGALLGISVLVNNGPQVWVSLKEPDLAGIAPSTWLIAIADASLWGAYGVATGDWALVGYGAILVLSSVLILSRIWWTRRAARPFGVKAALASP